MPMLESAEQWATWEYKIGIALKAGDVYGVVKGTEKKPVEGIDDYDKKLAEWEKKDFKAQRIITETISDDFTIHLLTCTTSKEIWDKMHTVFERQSESNKHALQQKFFAFQKEPNDNIATHISRLNKLVLQLRNVGVNIDESMVITRIIMTLPSEYRHFGSSWEATAEIDRTLQNLTNRLLAEETRVDSYQPNEVASQTTAFFSRGKQPDNKRKPGKCFKCHKHGHWKAQCDQQNAAKSEERKENKEAKSFMAWQEDNVAYICVENDDDDSFLLDCGATRHMCKRREWFTDYVELQQPIGITIGNGQKMYAIGRGNIRIQSFDGSKWIDGTLYDALYIPKLHRNLFSSIQAIDKGCKVYTDRSKCEVTKNGRTVAVGARNGNLFHMKFKVKQPQKQRFAYVLIEDDNLVEANRETATIAVENFPLKPTDKSIEITRAQSTEANKGDDVSSQSSVYTTASEGEKSDESTVAEASKIEPGNSDESSSAAVSETNVNESDDKLGDSKKVDNRRQSVSQQAGKVKDRRVSAVCDVIPENIIGPRLRKPREKNNDDGGGDGDTALLAYVDESKAKKKRIRRKFNKKNNQ